MIVLTCYFVYLGEEEEAPRGPDPKLIWDGQQSTIDQTTKLAQQSVTLDVKLNFIERCLSISYQQINEIHKQHGYVSDPNKERIGPGPLPPPMIPQPPPSSQMPPPAGNASTQPPLVPPPPVNASSGPP
ncbi:unnamed protein product, partial [Anisakis simplex]|uniref:Splicing factor 3A subunit 1 (inferred by orthology to a human protein) n=1 Tax=Anisakis simplex TaxID=6269 RepID=A0A0M3JIU4_ANISI